MKRMKRMKRIKRMKRMTVRRKKEDENEVRIAKIELIVGGAALETRAPFSLALASKASREKKSRGGKD